MCLSVEGRVLSCVLAMPNVKSKLVMDMVIDPMSYAAYAACLRQFSVC